MRVYQVNFSIYGVDTTVAATIYVQNDFPVITICFRVPLHNKAIISALSCLNAMDVFYCEINQIKFKTVFDGFGYSQPILCADCPAPYYEVDLSILRNTVLEKFLMQFGNGYTAYPGVPIID